MDTLTAIPTPEKLATVEHSPPWQSEKEAFLKLFPQLLKDYENNYVAIYQGKVVATGKKCLETSVAAFEAFGNVPIYVHLVSATPEKPKHLFSPLFVLSRC